MSEQADWFDKTNDMTDLEKTDFIIRLVNRLAAAEQSEERAYDLVLAVENAIANIDEDYHETAFDLQEHVDRYRAAIRKE